jgi:hypothetical protein
LKFYWFTDLGRRNRCSIFVNKVVIFLKYILLSTFSS